MGKIDELIAQIDAFIRKYYKNLMIKGVLFFAIIFLFTFLIISGLEYIGQFNSFIRGTLFFSFILLNGYVLFRYFITPLLKLFSFGKQISRMQAARIIGDFFPDVNDKLLNTLQLRDASSSAVGNLAFLQASIQHNAKELNHFKFVQAIDYKKNKKFLTYFLPIFFITLLVGIFVPNFLSDGSSRIFNYNEVYAVEPDFSFYIENFNNLVEEGDNTTLHVKIIPKPGKAVPNEIYFVSNEGTFLMNKTAKDEATFTLKNVNDKVKFYFKAENNSSHSYTLNVAKRSVIGHLDVALNFPKYLKRDNKTINNPGDLIVPEGTHLIWNGVVKNADQLKIISSDTTRTFPDGGFRFVNRALHSSQLNFILLNRTLHKSDSNFHQIEVIKDRFPLIDVKKSSDSTQTNRIDFSGNVKDDYGISRLVFTYKITNPNGKNISKSIAVPGISGLNSPFYMRFSISDLPLGLNDRLVYYFTVYDNDGIHGPKATKSQIFDYKSPSEEELIKQRVEEKNQATKSMNDLVHQTQSFNQRLKRFRSDIANSKNYTWEQKQEIKSIQEQRNNLQKQIENLKRKMNQSFDKKDKLSPSDQKMKDKEKTLQKLLDNIMDKELKDLLNKLAQKLQQNDQHNMQPLLKESEQNAQNLDKQMQRTMEFLKRMDVTERTQDVQKSLENLAKQQDSLNRKYTKGMNKDKAAGDQNKLNKSFQSTKNQLDSLLKKNKALKSPLSLKGLDSMSNEISNEMKNASHNISNSKKSDADKNQKSASEKMKEMASQMQAQMSSNEEKKKSEDLRAMKQIQENLLRLSFSQENNMNQFSVAGRFDPLYTKLGVQQQDIMDNFIPLKDSLEALADRIPKISTFIQQEVGGIQKQFNYIPDLIDERHKRQLSSKQHFVMTHLNNLALFIDESIKNAQKQMKGMGMGKGSCNTPGGKGKSGKSGMSQTLQQLKDMIKQQLKSMDKGPNPGGKQPGNQPGNGSQGQGGMLLPMNSEKAAKMAAQMAKMQQMLNQLQQQLQQRGEGNKAGINALNKEIEDQKRDLINKKWDNELIDRQHRILTRMLQSEKAIKERGFQKKRESKSGKDKDYSNHIQFLEYKKQKEKQIELLKTLDPSFSQYYKDKANDYFNKVNQ